MYQSCCSEYWSKIKSRKSADLQISSAGRMTESLCAPASPGLYQPILLCLAVCKAILIIFQQFNFLFLRPIFDDRPPLSDRPKPELSTSAETEYSAPLPIPNIRFWPNIRRPLPNTTEYQYLSKNQHPLPFCLRPYIT
jgi:hypothetical protein